MNIIGRKKLYFLVSAFIIIPGILALVFYGLNLSIDFTGGSRLTLSFDKNVTSQEVEKIDQVLEEEEIRVSSIEKSEKIVFVRTEVIDQETNDKLLQNLKDDVGKFQEEEFETIGPTIGSETTTNAVKGILLASVLIVLYITLAFRRVPKPASSFRFGVCAIIALIHDVLVVLGLFAIFGHFFNVEIDSLFVTAVLTIIGFSVHDTIVVFDRIRENLKRMPTLSFDRVANESILQTIDRSLNTSLTVILVLFALLLFGGESIRWFVAALLIGIVAGTYSSIFIASSLLVIWQDFSNRRRKKS